ncbi:MAG: class I SAM-dependent methyltransferase [Saprospiraceae bacterium]|nr:class I SAM-dependent methyltransferase [Saprospiraceae bacterium]
MNEFDEMAATWDDDPIRMERAASIAQSMRDILDMGIFQNALEYGSGTGLLSFALEKDLKSITLMDESFEMTRVAIEKCKASQVNHLHPIRMDLMFDQYQPKSKFDLIFILLTLHHINDTEGILSRFKDIINPNGILAIIDLESEDGSFHDREFHGHLGFDRNELEKKVTGAGFQPKHYDVIYNIVKGEDEDKRSYPLFLMIAQSLQDV